MAELKNKHLAAMREADKDRKEDVRHRRRGISRMRAVLADPTTMPETAARAARTIRNLEAEIGRLETGDE